MAIELPVALQPARYTAGEAMGTPTHGRPTTRPWPTRRLTATGALRVAEVAMLAEVRDLAGRPAVLP